MENRINIIGAGCVCAAGATLTESMNTMFSGSVTPVMPTRFEDDLPTPSPVFEVPQSFLTSNEKHRTGTVNLLFSAVNDAFSTASFDLPDIRQFKVGVCIGTSVGASLNFLDFYHHWRAGQVPDLFPIRRYLQGNPAHSLMRHLDSDGPCQTVTNACTSGTDAIGIAAAWIRHGFCDIAIAGGADELDPISYTGFTRLMITSPEPCRPFDRDRRGLNLGEGAGVFILASDRAAKNLGVQSQSQIRGYGTCGDAHHLTAPHPEGLGLRNAIQEALKQAELTAESVDFINVHGTGTPTNDPIESTVITDCFPKTLISATKGFTGHTLGAAGAIEAIFTDACLKRGELPPSQGFSTIDPEIPATPVTGRTPFKGDIGLSQSLAFGGNNSVLVITGSQI